MTQIPVQGGAIPTSIQGPPDRSTVPALVVAPSIYGPGADLLDRLAPLADRALILVPDPFWRTGEGAVDYRDLHTALARLEGFDVMRADDEMLTVAA
jgi:dienelactone hydrolase